MTTTNTSPTGAQVFVFDARGLALPAEGRSGDGVAALQPAARQGQRRRLQRRRQPRLRRLRRERRHRQPRRRRRSSRSWSRSTTTRSTSSTTTARRCSPRPGSRNRESEHAGRRLGWGQFIRWLDPAVEARHYHEHAGPWPDVQHDDVAAVDGLASDGRRPRRRRQERGDRPAERGAEGAVRDAGATRSWCSTARTATARGRRAGTRLREPAAVRQTGRAAARATGIRRRGIPAPTVVDILGDRRPEIVASVPDGFVYAVGPTGKRLWRFDYAKGAPKTFASEVVAADLNRDGKPELVFGTYALAPGSGRLVVLSAAGKRLHDIRLPRQGQQRQRDRRPRGALDRRPRRRRHARDRALDVRPRHRRLPCPGLGHEPACRGRRDAAASCATGRVRRRRSETAEGRFRGPQSLYGSCTSRPAIATPSGRSVCFTRIESPWAARTSGRRLYTSGASSAPPPISDDALLAQARLHGGPVDQARLELLLHPDLQQPRAGCRGNALSAADRADASMSQSRSRGAAAQRLRRRIRPAAWVRLITRPAPCTVE